MAEFTVEVVGLYSKTATGAIEAETEDEAVAKARRLYHQAFPGMKGTVWRAGVVQPEEEEGAVGDAVPRKAAHLTNGSGHPRLGAVGAGPPKKKGKG